MQVTKIYNNKKTSKSFRELSSKCYGKIVKPVVGRKLPSERLHHKQKFVVASYIITSPSDKKTSIMHVDYKFLTSFCCFTTGIAKNSLQDDKKNEKQNGRKLCVHYAIF